MFYCIVKAQRNLVYREIPSKHICRILLINEPEPEHSIWSPVRIRIQTT